MKVLKKLATFIATFLVVFSMGAVPVLAAEGKITITPPDKVKATDTNIYKIYKVFDAVGDGNSISYKLIAGKTAAPAGFSVDTAGNVTYTGAGEKNQLTADDIKAIADYVTEADLVDTVTSTGTNPAVSKDLPNGYYYITTSTGTAVTIDSTNPNVAVNDKNSVPSLNKKITGADEMSEDGKKALAQIGKEVEYTVNIKVGKGSKNLVFHDKMDEGLTFAGNGKVTVTGVEPNQFTIKDTPDTGDTITITFADGIAADTEISITYVGIVNKDAVKELENDAYLSYGDGHTTEHEHADVYNARIHVIKEDQDKKPLSGAGFVLYRKNKEGNKEYYKLSADGKSISWESEIANADEHVSGTDGKVDPFIGLSNGTYYLEEKTVPAGYNKAADVEVKIAGGKFTEGELVKLTHTETITNKQGSLLPSTGGIGTTIFYILGGILVVAGVAYFMVRRKVNAE